MTILSIFQPASTAPQRRTSERESLAPKRAVGSFDLLCTSCGYGVAVRIAPDRCPMCGGSTWEHLARRMPLDFTEDGEQPEAA